MRDAWERAAGAPQLGLAGLLLLLSLACASASAPVTPAPRVSTGTPVADGIVQTVVKKVDFGRNDLENPPFAAPTVQDGSRPGIAPGRTELVPTQATPQA